MPQVSTICANYTVPAETSQAIYFWWYLRHYKCATEECQVFFAGADQIILICFGLVKSAAPII